MLCYLTLSSSLYLNPLSAAVGGPTSGKLLYSPQNRPAVVVSGTLTGSESVPVRSDFSVRFDEGTCKKGKWPYVLNFILKLSVYRLGFARLDTEASGAQ